MFDYQLLDSGDGQKFERFGERSIVRPCKTAIWSRKLDSTRWSKADAQYEPDGGWKGRLREDDPWSMQIGTCSMQLRLQRNGQVGIFPEHASYLPSLTNAIEGFRKRGSVRVLNLFGYTGLASVHCALEGAEVVHVDISRAVLEWARSNMSVNHLSTEQVRLVEEDALCYLAREARRGSRYNLILLDPPSFSRVSKSKTWSLEEIAAEIVELVAAVADRERFFIGLAHHSLPFRTEVFENLLRDVLDVNEMDVEGHSLSVQETLGGRKIPAGFFVCCRTREIEHAG
ncbi:MAG: class I SAM-dependent methyltransferase [Bdellovibrionales bacterium]|nr:class I SAM-dependent methyltransferase [Bdellovibrionales bacterium]